MSQHHFFTEHEGQKTHVLMGWYRPLQGYFLVIDKEFDEDAPYWSNLNCAISHPKQLTPFLHVLKKKHIALPEPMMAALRLDAAENTGNKQMIHRITSKGYQCIEGVDPSHESLGVAFAQYGQEKNIINAL